MTETGQHTALDFASALGCGMAPAVTAREFPDRPAIMGKQGTLTFDQLNANANRLLHSLRARGVEAGDAVALLSSNRFEFVETYVACARGGLRLTPINWHLQMDEVAYIVDNCDAKVFLADVRFAEVAKEVKKHTPKTAVCLAIGGTIDGFLDYGDTLASASPHDPVDPVSGGTMLYTSGTTGRPKGVSRDKPSSANGMNQLVGAAARMNPAKDVMLSTGPLYHAGPLTINLIAPLTMGLGIVVMDKFNAEEALALIDRFKATHTHMVATMFHRMLNLPDSVKNRYDISSMRFIIHGAAPTPIEIKKAMMDWFGPVLYEYYSGTEGSVAFIGPEDWLEKPGSVGQPVPGQDVVIQDDTGSPLPQGEIGTVFIKAPDQGRFKYYKDEEKTSSTYRGDFFTMGDMGFFDEDGFLFLTGRSADVILSGGVNIYAIEADNILARHPLVADVATVGIPNEEWGEEVKSVVQLKEGVHFTDDLAEELISFCRDNLTHLKCPRSIDFDPALPRRDDGKILRRLVRDRYWPDKGQNKPS